MKHRCRGCVHAGERRWNEHTWKTGTCRDCTRNTDKKRKRPGLRFLCYGYHDNYQSREDVIRAKARARGLGLAAVDDGHIQPQKSSYTKRDIRRLKGDKNGR